MSHTEDPALKLSFSLKVIGHYAVDRLLTFVLVLGLTIIGPSPLSICALFSATLGDCLSAETRPQCDKIDMGEHTAPTVTSRSNSCCAISQAPLPEFKTGVSKIAVKLELAVAQTSATAVNSEKVRASSVPLELSPPPLRSLLCTFLI